MIRLLTLFVFSCLTAGAADKYALLIANGKYMPGQHLHDLEGPPNDLSSIAGLLGKEYGFAAANVRVLKDGTRADIIAAFEQLVTRVHFGDFVFIYYSGHGTSPQDPVWHQTLPIDADAGALLPSDFRLGTPDQVTQRLVVGRRDLRPRLLALDAKATVFALLDTCFSQNLMKDVMPVYRGAPRSVSTRDLTLRSPGIEDDASNDLKDIAVQSKPSPYPYRHVAWISAAQAGESAVDLDKRVLNANPKATYDGLAHGQFTNALMVGLQGAADLNHDGSISNSELYEFLVKTAERDHWSHQPALSMSDDDSSFAKSLALGGRSKAITSGQDVRPQGKVRIMLDNALELAGAIASAGMEIGDKDPDLIVSKQGAGYWIREGSGIPVIDAPIGKEEALARIQAEPGLRALRNWSYTNQKTNASMSLWKDADRLHQGVFLAGNQFEIHANAEGKVWPLVVDIDKDGVVTVLYPRKGEPVEEMRGERNLGLNGVVCPCGIEYLKAFLFEREPAGFEAWGGKQFGPASADMKKLMDLLKSGVGETTERVITNPK